MTMKLIYFGTSIGIIANIKAVNICGPWKAVARSTWGMVWVCHQVSQCARQLRSDFDMDNQRIGPKEIIRQQLKASALLVTMQILLDEAPFDNFNKPVSGSIVVDGVIFQSGI